MKTPEELTGWTLQVRLYRLKPILVATSPHAEKEYWVQLELLDKKVPAHEFLDHLDAQIGLSCMSLVELIKRDLRGEAIPAKEQPNG